MALSWINRNLTYFQPKITNKFHSSFGAKVVWNNFTTHKYCNIHRFSRKSPMLRSMHGHEHHLLSYMTSQTCLSGKTSNACIYIYRFQCYITLTNKNLPVDKLWIKVLLSRFLYQYFLFLRQKLLKVTHNKDSSFFMYEFKLPIHGKNHIELELNRTLNVTMIAFAVW